MTEHRYGLVVITDCKRPWFRTVTGSGPSGTVQLCRIEKAGLLVDAETTLTIAPHTGTGEEDKAPCPDLADVEDQLLTWQHAHALVSRDRDRLAHALAEATATIVAKDARIADLGESVVALGTTLGRRDARIAELDSELGRRPAAFIDPDQQPKPLAQNPFRAFPVDPRRLGG